MKYLEKREVVELMKRISEITKRDIFDLLRNGIEKVILFDKETLFYPYYGRLEEIDFLNRIYDLKNMPSTDSRFQNAEGDIWQHTINNDDYPFCWVFEDERFQLEKGSDEIYLKFICEIFHPAVRDENGCWKEIFDEINTLLKNDQYELYPIKKISNREVYGWRVFKSEENKLFIPYSQRHKAKIKNKRIVLSIKRNARNQIYQLLKSYDYTQSKVDETGWNYYITTSEEVLNDIRQFYKPKCYNHKQEYVETDNFENFVCYSSPYCVIDVIELFGKYNSDNDFEIQINQILNLNGIKLRLINGKIESMFNSQIKGNILENVQEVGLHELLQEASVYYDEDNFKIAAEKLWDAFERLKSYYCPTLNKKKSVNRIIDEMSNNEEPYRELFEKEFYYLTHIGNAFRIRHHETTKIDIESASHYDYFYRRCLSLISVAIQYLDERNFY